MAARRNAKRQTHTTTEQVDGAATYLKQAHDRVAELELGDTLTRNDMTMIEVARDETRQAAKLMQKVHERATRAVAKPRS